MYRSSTSKGNGKRGIRPRGGGAPRSARTIRLCAPALIAGLLLFQFGCLLFHRHRTPAAAPVPQSPIRIAFLPLNTPPDNPETRWLSLAAPIIFAKAGENAPDLEIVPFWESMPVTVQLLGTSRSIGPDQAAYIAGLLTAKWATAGEFAAAKNGISVLVDFMPAKEILIPFRYERQTNLDSLQGNFREALTQFVRYQVVKPTATEVSTEDVAALRELAQALDLEYGWFVPADPGKSEKVVTNLAKSDNRLAQVLFNPNLYPAIARTAPESQEKKPAGAASPDKPPSAPATSPTSPPRHRGPRQVPFSNP